MVNSDDYVEDGSADWSGIGGAVVGALLAAAGYGAASSIMLVSDGLDLVRRLQIGYIEFPELIA